LSGKARTDRIRQDVGRDISQVFLGPQHAVVEALLPQPKPRLALEVERCDLLEELDEPDQVRCVVPTENEGVQVIWHKREGQEPEVKTASGSFQVLYAATGQRTVGQAR
jgi:hypothetical protein